MHGDETSAHGLSQAATADATRVSGDMAPCLAFRMGSLIVIVMAVTMTVVSLWLVMMVVRAQIAASSRGL